MCRFYTQGKEDIVIVDDYLAVTSEGTPSFVRGGKNSKEMWPCIMEKAYAKWYGSFSYIAAGKV